MGIWIFVWVMASLFTMLWIGNELYKQDIKKPLPKKKRKERIVLNHRQWQEIFFRFDMWSRKWEPKVTQKQLAKEFPLAAAVIHKELNNDMHTHNATDITCIGTPYC